MGPHGSKAQSNSQFSSLPTSTLHQLEHWTVARKDKHGAKSPFPPPLPRDLPLANRSDILDVQEVPPLEGHSHLPAVKLSSSWRRLLKEAMISRSSGGFIHLETAGNPSAKKNAAPSPQQSPAMTIHPQLVNAYMFLPGEKF